MSLDCYYCGREFLDFGPLADHVKKCSARINGSKEPEKEEDMLPKGGSSDEPRSRSKRGSSAIPFLKGEEMLSKTPKEAKILGVRHDPNNRFGDTVLVKLALDGQTVMWSIRVRNNPNLEILTEKFGRDENDWAGQKILLFLEQDEFTEQWYPRVDFPKPVAKSKA